MSLLIDPFYSERFKQPIITSVRTTLEVVPCEGDVLRVNIIVDEDDFGLVGRPGEIVFSALTTLANLFDPQAYFNIELTHAIDEWEVDDAR